MTVLVEPVRTRRDLKRFIDLPYRLYAGHPCWVPPLRSAEQRTLSRRRNPSFDHCEAAYWLAYDGGGRPVGRIAGIINHRYIETWGRRQARFGWIDFVDDRRVSTALLDRFEEWAHGGGMTAVHGPLGFTDLDREGMLVEGFEEPGTAATIYNHAYYPAHLEDRGYHKDVDWVEFQLCRPPELPAKIARLAGIVAERYGLRILRARRIRELFPYARDMLDAVNAAYRDLYGFVPLTDAEMDAYIRHYLAFLRADCMCVVLDRNDRVAAIAISMPSLTRALQRCRGRLLPFGWLSLRGAMRRNDAIDFCLIGVRPEWQARGASILLMRELGRFYLDKGFTVGETNHELEGNLRVQALWKMFDARQHKRRRCYRKEL